MIKNFRKFNENNQFPPSRGSKNSLSATLDDEDSSFFKREPILSNLISDEKISLVDNILWYYKDDKETISILKEYFPDKIVQMRNEK